MLPDGAARRGTAPPGMQIVDKSALFMPDAALTPYPAYKIVKLNTLQNFRRPDKRSASGSLPLPSVLYGF